MRALLSTVAVAVACTPAAPPTVAVDAALPPEPELAAAEPQPSCPPDASGCARVEVENGWVVVDGVRTDPVDALTNMRLLPGLQSALRDQYESFKDNTPRDKPFRATVLVAIPGDAEPPVWKSVLATVGESAFIDMTLAQGPRLVMVVGGLRDDAEVLIALLKPNGLSLALWQGDAPGPPVGVRGDAVEAALRQLCGDDTDCFSVIHALPDALPFGELVEPLRLLTRITPRGRAIRFVVRDQPWEQPPVAP